MKKLYHIYTNNAIYSRVAESEAQAVFEMCTSPYFDNNKTKVIERIETETSTKAVYEHLALIYAENHGIIEYHTDGHNMIYYSSFPYEHSTIKAVVNLDTMKETRHGLKNYYKSYKSLVGGKYQVNYCI